MLFAFAQAQAFCVRTCVPVKPKLTQAAIDAQIAAAAKNKADLAAKAAIPTMPNELCMPIIEGGVPVGC